MIAVTENAAVAIRSLTADHDVATTGGLRIAADAAGEGLQLSLAPEPESGDQIVDHQGARLFLDADAALLLDDKALDARLDEQGEVKFALAHQPE